MMMMLMFGVVHLLSVCWVIVNLFYSLLFVLYALGLSYEISGQWGLG